LYVGKQRAESDIIHMCTHDNHMHEITMTPSPNMAFPLKRHPRLDGWRNSGAFAGGRTRQ
jgi:hypothetical protein